MAKRDKKIKAVVIPASILAELDCAVLTDRSTGELVRFAVKLPGLNDFMLTSDLEPTAKFFEGHYGLTTEQSMKAVEYLASLPNKRAAVERHQRAQAKRENSNRWGNWHPKHDL